MVAARLYYVIDCVTRCPYAALTEFVLDWLLCMGRGLLCLAVYLYDVSGCRS